MPESDDAILLLDDDVEIATVLTEFLRNRGHRALADHTGAQLVDESVRLLEVEAAEIRLLDGNEWRPEGRTVSAGVPTSETSVTVPHRLCVALRIQDRTMGLLDVYAKDSRTFTADDVSLLSALADHATVAIHKARLLREAEEERRVVE